MGTILEQKKVENGTRLKKGTILQFWSKVLHI